MDPINILYNDIKFIIPSIFLSVSIFTLLIVGVQFKKEDGIFYINWLSIQALGITLLLIINNPFTESILFNGFFKLNLLTNVIQFIIISTTIVILLLSIDYMKFEKITAYEYNILILLATLGLILLITSNDLLVMYLAIELQSLCLYVLASYKRNSELSTEAGLKYFILGALSSGILLFGSSLIYGLTGSTNFENLNHLLLNISNDGYSYTGILLGVIFIGAALLFKLAAVPFHMWAPDVYEGSPTIVTAYFAIVPKIAILGLLAGFYLESFYGLMNEWQDLLIFSALGSMIVGALGALQQTKLKRLIAYSAIGHIGYMLIGLGCGTPEGIQSLLLYNIVYIIMSINLFTLILMMTKRNENHQVIRIKNLKDLAGLSNSNPVLAITLALTVLSMAGIPPLAGFLSKLYIFIAAIESSMYILALLGVLTSVIGSVYYIRLIKIMYFDQTKNEFLNSYSLIQVLLIGMTLLFTIFFIFNPTFLLILTHNMSITLSF